MRRDDWRIEWALSAVNVALMYAAYLASFVAGALWLAWGLALAPDVMTPFRATAAAVGLWVLQTMFDVWRDERDEIRELS